jgi:hypothetical protein
MMRWLGFLWPTTDHGLGRVSEWSLRYWTLRETRERAR